MSRSVFLSYRGGNASSKSKRAFSTVRSILQNDYDVVVGRENGALGDSFSSDVRRMISSADLFVLIVDRRWLLRADQYGRRLIDDENDWQRLEVSFALELEIPIVPILLDDAELPPAEALPEQLRDVSFLRYVSFQTGQGTPKFRYDFQDAVAAQTSSKSQTLPKLDFQILSLQLENFRCFESLQIDFSGESILEGDWTCIAGLNGSGKSTILQAIALILMGPENAREIGGKRLSSMRRIGSAQEKTTARLRANVQVSGIEYFLEMTIGVNGPKSDDMSFWSNSDGILLAGYGASRNLSDAPDRYEEVSDIVGAFISLFDPMARLQSAEALLNRRTSVKNRPAAVDLFHQIVGAVFSDEIELKANKALRSRMKFSSGGAFHEASDLPDGYRSSIAWLADLCVHFAASQKRGRPTELSNISGLVLIDEVDLHLHASLQRVLVPRLRRVLPGVQWIVSSHAPLVLASFDRSELLTLDESQDGGIRTIGNQVIGLTADQIYEYLLNTPPSSEAAELILEKALSDGELGALGFDDLLEQLAGPNEPNPKLRMERIRSRVKELKR